MNSRTLDLLRHDDALGYALERGLSLDSIRHFEIGYYAPDKFSHLFSGRLVFPIHDLYGNFLTYQSRVIPGLSKLETPKYWHGSYPKDTTLYGLHKAILPILDHKYVVVVEGPIDVAVLWEFGVPAVATFGTSFSDSYALLLKRFTDQVYVWRDADEAGKKSADVITNMCQRHSMRVKVFSHQKYKDPSELYVAKGYNNTERFLYEAIDIRNS